MEISKRDKTDLFSKSKSIIELTPKNFDQISTWKLKSPFGCSIVLFYAPWCPFCHKISEVWEKLAQTAGFFDVCAFNCEKHKKHLLKIKEDMPELVKGFPTIIVYKNGEPIEQHMDEGNRTVESFLSLCMRACKK